MPDTLATGLDELTGERRLLISVTRACLRPCSKAVYKPLRRVPNEDKHRPNWASDGPTNACELFDRLIDDGTGVPDAKHADGTIHRFSKSSTGETLWKGSTAGPWPIL